MTMFEEIKQKAEETRQMIANDPKYEDVDRRAVEILFKFLSQDTCFVINDVLLCYKVLKFVGYEDSELNEVYDKVFDEQMSKINFDAMFGPRYKYVDPELFGKSE